MKLRLVARALLPIDGDIRLPPPAFPLTIPPEVPEDPDPPDVLTTALGPPPVDPDPGGIGPKEFSGVAGLDDCELGPVPAELIAATLKV